jgi:hypothetical protein
MWSAHLQINYFHTYSYYTILLKWIRLQEVNQYSISISNIDKANKNLSLRKSYKNISRFSININMINYNNPVSAIYKYAILDHVSHTNKTRICNRVTNVPRLGKFYMKQKIVLFQKIEVWISGLSVQIYDQC